ncbi:MAG: hypothetical protein FJ319_05230 [SAR202 cluster bacterium]|nr:hypothetical protein [SAR202 cluster bacterium]
MLMAFDVVMFSITAPAFTGSISAHTGADAAENIASTIAAALSMVTVSNTRTASPNERDSIILTASATVAACTLSAGSDGAGAWARATGPVDTAGRSAAPTANVFKILKLAPLANERPVDTTEIW